MTYFIHWQNGEHPATHDGKLLVYTEHDKPAPRIMDTVEPCPRGRLAEVARQAGVSLPEGLTNSAK